jgi:hypothetical protein
MYHPHNLVFRDAPSLDLLTRDAPLAAQSYNAEARTLEVTVSSGADVERRDAKGVYFERIAIDQDWGGLLGAPVLNAHNRSDIKNILGSVVEVRTIAGEVRAIIRMSRSPEGEAALQDILQGHLRAVSFGYRIEAVKESVENGKRIITVTKLTPVELSLVPIGADPHALIRSTSMEIQTTQPDPPSVDRGAINAEIRSIAKVAGLPQSWVDNALTCRRL